MHGSWQRINWIMLGYDVENQKAVKGVGQTQNTSQYHPEVVGYNLPS